MPLLLQLLLLLLVLTKAFLHSDWPDDDGTLTAEMADDAPEVRAAADTTAGRAHSGKESLRQVGT